MCLLEPEFIITVNMDLGLKKWEEFVGYNREFNISEFVTTMFHCIVILIGFQPLNKSIQILRTPFNQK
jgi:hypothetical protein